MMRVVSFVGQSLPGDNIPEKHHDNDCYRGDALAVAFIGKNWQKVGRHGENLYRRCVLLDRGQCENVDLLRKSDYWSLGIDAESAWDS